MIVTLPGWNVTFENNTVTVAAATDPPDRDGNGYFRGLSEQFHVSETWDRQQVAQRIFTTIQFLQDHELREGFKVDGERIFETHEPSLTGQQHDWWVEQQSALKGY